MSVRFPHQARRTGRRTGFIVFLLLAGAAARVQAQPAAEHRFLWDQANARMATAQTPVDFAGAAELYRRLTLAGVRNAPLFQNYGTALLEAGRPDDALQAFQRAERFAGNDAAIRRDLAAARARRAGGTAATLPWPRIFAFWHYGLDLATRLAVACAGFSLLCLALALRVWNRHAAARQVHIVAVTILVVFGSSVGASLHAESRDQERERARQSIQAKPTPRTDIDANGRLHQ